MKVKQLKALLDELDDEREISLMFNDLDSGCWHISKIDGIGQLMYRDIDDYFIKGVSE